VDQLKVPELPAQISSSELAQAAFIDTNIYGRTFFPQAFRMPSPSFHKDIDFMLDTPGNRFVAAAVFRGGAKTTRGRVKCSQRIAYGVSRTVMVISRGQSHAISTVEWIHRNVSYNEKWASFYQLKPGHKWSPGTGDIEVIHEGMGHSIRVIAAGITGQVRGFNFEDYRPDFILLDDIDDEETTNTPDQRLKTANLVHGAIANSLTPTSENPWAQLLFLQTPLHREDQVETCIKDPTWITARYGCFDESGNSRWPERWSAQELMKMKESYTARNQLGLWMREMECTLVRMETKAFRESWLNYWETLPEQMAVYIAIDPASSDSKYASYQACVAIGVYQSKVFLLEYTRERGQDPEALISKLFQMRRRYGGQVRAVGVETVAYQKTLKWYIEQTMKRTNFWMTVVEVKDRRPKPQRIRDGIRDLAFNGLIYIHKAHQEFLSDYVDYDADGEGGVPHPDLLDAFAMALGMINPYETGAYADPTFERAYEPLDYARSAP
jgi:hypothetical protein